MLQLEQVPPLTVLQVCTFEHWLSLPPVGVGRDLRTISQLPQT